MRQKTIVEGFRNGQRFRFILREPGSAHSVGMYITVKQMSEDFVTAEARAAVWTTLNHLAMIRRVAQHDGTDLPVGVVRRHELGFDVQVDLC